VLPPAARLRRREDFTRATRAGRRTARGGLVVHLADPVRLVRPVGSGGSAGGGPEERLASGPARVGFVVPKAVGGAVVRNRVVRRLRHLVRARLEALPRESTVVVRAMPSAAGLTSVQLGSDLDAALGRLLRRQAPVEHRPAP